MVVGLRAIDKEKYWCKWSGTWGKRGKARTSGESVLPSSTSAPFFLGVRYCGHGAELRVKGGGCGSGATSGAGCSRAQGEEECTLRAGGEKWPPFH